MSLFFSGLKWNRKPIFIMVLIVLCWPAFGKAESEVRIDIVKTPGRKVRMALPGFFLEGDGNIDGKELHEIMVRDLSISGFFDVITVFPEKKGLNGLEAIGRPEEFDELVGRAIELLVNVHCKLEDKRIVLEGLVFDPATRQQIFGKRYRAGINSRVKMVHVLSGDIIKELTGVPPLTQSRLSFLWDGSGSKQVHVSDYDGRDPTAVSPAGELALFPKWLPNGQSLVYTSFVSGLPELVHKDIDRGHQKILTSYPGMNASVSFSPDGTNFLATLSKDGNPEIYKLDLRGRILQRMTYNRTVDTSPTYSPDGEEFAFVSDRSGGPRIYVMRSNGGKPVRITYQGHYNVSPDWSPGGNYIAYTSIIGGRFQLMLMNPSGKEVIQLTDGPGNKEDPEWGVDNRHLVFTLTKGYKSDLYIIDIYTKEMTQITGGKGNFTSPSWSKSVP